MSLGANPMRLAYPMFESGILLQLLVSTRRGGRSFSRWGFRPAQQGPACVLVPSPDRAIKGEQPGAMRAITSMEIYDLSMTVPLTGIYTADTTSSVALPHAGPKVCHGP